MKYLKDYTSDIQPKKDLLDMIKNQPEEGGEGEAETIPITQVNFVEDYYSLFLMWY